MSTAEENNENAPLAFALVTFAGLSTGLGAAFVFNKRLVKLASKKVLAGSLGLAAGVMLYISLTKIFIKSQGAFSNHGSPEPDAYLYATLSLFGGIVFYEGIDFVVHLLQGGPVGDHDFFDRDGPSSTDSPRTAAVDVADGAEDCTEEGGASGGVEDGGIRATGTGDGAKVAPSKDERLARMGLMTAVAIGLHNLPEGLATFVATLSEPPVGFALALGIAIHNIPDGLCVAMPIYYATGNRWKAFGWALLSGISEPIGAGLGWLILKDIMSDLVYGILFGVVAGMMTSISVQELIPTAVRYDPADKVTTKSIFAGMVIVALSLTIFMYTE